MKNLLNCRISSLTLSSPPLELCIQVPITCLCEAILVCFFHTFFRLVQIKVNFISTKECTKSYCFTCMLAYRVTNNFLSWQVLPKIMASLEKDNMYLFDIENCQWELVIIHVQQIYSRNHCQNFGEPVMKGLS